jgi:ABC-type branched-subunit amino acid transport system substrate-binding protein
VSDPRPQNVLQLPSVRVVAAFLVGLLVGAASVVQVVPNYTGATAGPGVEETTGSNLVDGALDGELSDDVKGAGKGSGGKKGPAAGPEGAGPTSQGALPPSRPGLECSRSGNGGETDRGVGSDVVKMATTVAESGFANAFLGEVRFGMEAVRGRINRAGGICGRGLNIEYRDDAWDPQRGAQYLRNFIQQGIFAIPVCPSSEGCRVVIASGDLDSSKIPMAGTDGMLIEQYQKEGGSTQPFVWPVASATVSSARIMCKDAYRRGARNFSIVFDKNYKFGAEGAEAFNACVKQLTGKNISGYNGDHNCQESFCGVLAAQSSYAQEAARFREGDFVALFLDPKTAEKWMSDPNSDSASDIKYSYGAAQPLFTRGFAVNCQSQCHGMQVWTGFRPPIEAYARQPAVKRYVEDLKRTKPDADEYNAFTEGGYVGMLLLEAALKKVGPDLTRERLKVALDHTCLNTGLTIQKTICFAPNNRFANVTMQAFTIQYRGQFAGWRAGQIVRDPAK